MAVFATITKKRRSAKFVDNLLVVVEAPVAVVLYLSLEFFFVALGDVLVCAPVVHDADVAKLARSHKLDPAKPFFAKSADVRPHVAV
jgi:hypothetical protein